MLEKGTIAFLFIHSLLNLYAVKGKSFAQVDSKYLVITPIHDGTHLSVAFSKFWHVHLQLSANVSLVNGFSLAHDLI